MPEHVGPVTILEQRCGLEVWRLQDYVSLLKSDTTFHGLVSVIEDLAESGNYSGPSLPECTGWDKTQVVGFIAGRILGPEAEIYKLAVEPGYQRQGIGGRMMRQFLGMAQSRGAINCYLEVRQSNVSAIAFYRSHGFVGHKVRAQYYSNPLEDALVMLRQGDRRQ